MQTLTDFIKKLGCWIVFLILEAISLTIFFKHNSYQGSIWFTSANDMVAAINGYHADFDAFVNLQTTNKELTYQNIQLQKQITRLQDELEKTGHKTTKAEVNILDSLADFNMIPAKVTLNSIHKKNNLIIIDKGEMEGVKKEMGVVGGGGVVGIVIMTAMHHAMVMPIINENSNISCRIRSSQEYFGYLQWHGKDPRYAYLIDIPKYAKIKRGTYIETSGYSTVFPKGLLVGQIVGIENSSDGLSTQLNVRLSTNFEHLRDVYVVENPDKEETDSLYARLNRHNTQINEGK